jgi:hypothetical protein
MDRRRFHQTGGGQSLVFLFATNSLEICGSPFHVYIRIMRRLTSRDLRPAQLYILIFDSGVRTSSPFSGVFRSSGLGADRRSFAER